MLKSDYFIADGFGSGFGGTHRIRFNQKLVVALRRGPLSDRLDIEAAIPLLDLVHDELLAFGTRGGEQLDDSELEAALFALRAVTQRVGVDFEPPFRNFTTFKTYWIRNDASGSWHARRIILSDLLEPARVKLVALEERSLDALADPISPRTLTGWPRVDEEIRELRRRFQTATTPQDYRAIGAHCVGVLEALSRTVYEPARHLRDGETEPPVDKTKIRIGRFIDDSAAGPGNTAVRGLANKAVELSHQVKHSSTATRRSAGIAADAAMLLANILRRLAEDT
ncbi:hypothetical protein NLM24_19660 [Nocardia zapadnayensis]|nr:hypothetical protein [Nocardia zapadnayensis]MCX0272884.1 hypothetical protein [Nocardia zapadnayensis]